MPGVLAGEADRQRRQREREMVQGQRPERCSHRQCEVSHQRLEGARRIRGERGAAGT